MNINCLLLRPAADMPGRAQLQFPMTLSMEGFKQIIKIKKTDET